MSMKKKSPNFCSLFENTLDRTINAQKSANLGINEGLLRIDEPGGDPASLITLPAAPDVNFILNGTHQLCPRRWAFAERVHAKRTSCQHRQRKKSRIVKHFFFTVLEQAANDRQGALSSTSSLNKYFEFIPTSRKRTSKKIANNSNTQKPGHIAPSISCGGQSRSSRTFLLQFISVSGPKSKSGC